MFSLGRMKPFHDEPLTFDKGPGFSSADGGSYDEAASPPSHGSGCRNRPMRKQVLDRRPDLSGTASPNGRQTSTKDRGFRQLWMVSITIVPMAMVSATRCAPDLCRPFPSSHLLELHLAFPGFS